MAITLEHKVGELGNIYKGEGVFKADKIIHISILILAANGDEALSKLKEFISQEHPSFDQNKADFKVVLEMVVI